MVAEGFCGKSNQNNLTIKPEQLTSQQKYIMKSVSTALIAPNEQKQLILRQQRHFPLKVFNTLLCLSELQRRNEMWSDPTDFSIDFWLWNRSSNAYKLALNSQSNNGQKHSKTTISEAFLYSGSIWKKISDNW